MIHQTAGAVSAAADPPEPPPNPSDIAMYWKLLALPIAVTVKVPLYPAMLAPAIVTLLPTFSPAGLAVVIVTVTVVPLSDVDEIALQPPTHTAGNPAHAATPAAHVGIETVAVKAFAAGLYSSAVFNVTCPVGTPAGVEVPMNDCPVEPPTISTCPSSAVPLPSIRVALAPTRAAVIRSAAAAAGEREGFRVAVVQLRRLQRRALKPGDCIDSGGDAALTADDQTQIVGQLDYRRRLPRCGHAAH